MNYIDIHRALTQSLINASVGVPIAHENVTFNPDQHTAFVQPFTIIGDRDAIAKNGYGEVFGIYQIDVNVREGSAVGQALQIIDIINSYYTDSLELENGSTQVIILNRYRSNVSIENGWYTTSVTIDFRARPTV